MSKISFPPPSLVSLSRKLDPRGRGLTPPVARPETKAAPPSAQRGSVWAAVPAVLFLGLAAMFANRSSGPITVPPTVADSHEPLPIVTLSQTMIVTADDGSGTPTATLAMAPRVLRGRLRQEGGVISGRAPLGGSVARVWVRRGQRVNVGDPVLQLSQGSSSRPAPRAERAQNTAEAAQVAAAKQQEALNTRFADARTRLAAAQARVEAARQRVARATAVVRDLQTRQREGRLPSAPTTVAPVLPSAPGSPAPQQATAATSDSAVSDNAASQAAADRVEAARREAQVSKAASARRALLTAARRAQQEADRATDKAKAAQAATAAAEATSRLKTQKVSEARATSDAVQAAFDAKGAKGSDVEAARAGVVDAQSEAGEASTRATVARQESERLSAVAATARDRSTKAAQDAAASLRSLQLADTAPVAPRPRVRIARRRASRRIARAPQFKPQLAPLPKTSNASIAQAASLVRDAVAESEKAITDARDVQREVDNYQAQVQRTANRLGTTGKDLQNAQQNVLDHTLQVHLSSVRAPASGTVLSVAPLAANVAPGEPLVMVSQSGGWEARFQDFEGTWRALHPGMTLSALMPAGISFDRRPATTSGSPAATAAPGSSGATVLLRVREVVPPQRPNGPALIRAGLATVPGGHSLSEGRSILCSIAPSKAPGVAKPIKALDAAAAPVLRVPAAALVRDEAGRYLIAVLAPEMPVEDAPPTPGLTNGVPAANAADSAEPGAPNNRPAASLDDLMPDADALAAAPAPEDQPRPFMVDWRAVTVKGGAGDQRDIIAGLVPGERIFLEPSRLRPPVTAGATTPAALRTVQRVLLSLSGTA